VIVSVLAALLQIPAGAPAAQPVRLTLDPSTIAPGEAMHVFVEVATAGHLLVLRVASDGRIEVVFPATPSEGTFVSAGSYEIQPSGRTSAFVADEHAGGGVVLAALALMPFEIGEFVRDNAWDARALASGTGSDGTGRLLDVVQRMLGPEYFHYDVVSYTVAPYTTTESDGYGDVYGAAYGGFGCYGYGCYGFYPGLPALPCLYTAGGCHNLPMICDPFTGLWDCGPTGPFCIDARLGCRSHTAVARYRRGEPLAGPSPAPVQPGYGQYATLGAAAGTPKRAGGTAAPYTGASRSVPLSSGKPATAAAPTRTPRTARTDVRMPQRVPWPGQVLSSGTKTAAPAVSPRQAALKQSASRPALPQRVPWPGSAATRGVKPTNAPAAGLTPVVPGGRGALPVADSPKARSAVPASAIPTSRPTATAPAGRALTGSSRSGSAAALSGAAAPSRGASAKSGAASSGGGRAAAPAATGRAGKF
jgi:hypothetical protein